MTHTALARRLLRLRGEGGFSLVETMIAVTVIFGSLLALAYTATIGFDYMAYARERQSADALANQIMEQARGIPYLDIKEGLKTSLLASDPNVVECPGGSGVYRFKQCAAGSNGVGDKIVNTAGLPNTSPLVPNFATMTINSLAFTWRTYVTNDDPASSPYRVTVMVSWTSAALPNNATGTALKIQSLFWSPNGCVSSDTHPFAAPCQPFFYGLASVPSPSIQVSGSIQGLSTFTDATILGTGVESNGQVEQTSTLQSSYTPTGLTMTRGGSRSTLDGAKATVVANNDPTSGGQANPATIALTSGTGGDLTDLSGTTSYVVTDPTGESASAAAKITANGSNICPPPTSTAETDGLPCAGARSQQAGTLTSVLHPHGIDPDVGDATMAQIGTAASAPNLTLVDREAQTSADGRLETSGTRQIGTVSLGGLPANVAAPAGWTGYAVTMSGFSDTVGAQAGTSAPIPSANVSAGTVTYWNGTGYTSIAATADVPAFTTTVGPQTIGGKSVTITISSAGLTGAQATSASTPTGSGTLTRTDTRAQVSSPLRGSIRYQIQVNGSSVVDLAIDVNLGTLAARATYTPAPTAG